MRHRPYPHIENLGGVRRKLLQNVRYIGIDENNLPIFDESIPLPEVLALGTVKIHGTNAGVCLNSKGLWFQSRQRIITLETDNAGFAKFGEEKKQVFLDLLSKIQTRNNVDLTKQTISIFGEWCGNGIQKGVGVCKLSKRFIIFDIVLIDEENNYEYVMTTDIKSPDNNIFNTWDFEIILAGVNFDDLSKSKSNLNALTEKVEKDCPVARAFLPNETSPLIGEGIVYRFQHEGKLYKFKVKGDKHSEKIITHPRAIQSNNENISECVNKILPNWRLEQGLVTLFGFEYNKTIDRKKLGEYLRWVASDTFREEASTLEEYKLEWKDVVKQVQQQAKDYFFAVEENLRAP